MTDLATITIDENDVVRPVLSKAGLNNYFKVRDNSSEVAGYSFINDNLHLILKIKNYEPAISVKNQVIHDNRGVDEFWTDNQQNDSLFRVWERVFSDMECILTSSRYDTASMVVRASMTDRSAALDTSWQLNRIWFGVALAVPVPIQGF